MWYRRTSNVFACVAFVNRCRRPAVFSQARWPSTITSTHHYRAVNSKTKTRAQRSNVRDNVVSKNKISVDFEQTKEAYKSKNTLELLRSLLVFKLCSYDFLVDKNREVMALGEKLLGVKVFEQLMKMTFYGQFVAGEDHEAIRPLIEKNRAFGVGAVLDYSIEEDLSQEEADRKERESCMLVSEKEKLERRSMAHRRFADRRDRVTSARTYFYADEVKCDQHMEIFIKCIKASGGNPEDGFSAIKMTALGRPRFLLQFSEVLMKWTRFFGFLAALQGEDGREALEQRLDLQQVQACLTKLGAGGDLHGWFSREKRCPSGKQDCVRDEDKCLFFLASKSTIDMLDWKCLIDERMRISDLLVVPNLEEGRLELLFSRFTEEEERQMKRMLQRLDVLAKHATENSVRLMVDAEQTYFQPAISRLTLEMQRIFNRDKPVIFNTYQCYLKDAYENVSMDMELSRREGWCFGAKLVRGAYMHQERSRAAKIGYEDPINPDYETTNHMYHRCLDCVLEEIVKNRKANVMVATHNIDTVKHTLQRMTEMGLAPTDRKVYFGQLLGMCDQISFPLGQAGYPVYKYVPYGPVSEVLPYLSRRIQENRAVLKGVHTERELLWKEFMRRLANGELLQRPSL
ncbi:proline dehydrogenase 1, mitochondrial isoform X2 [Electrophorus electricus]|uniref:proline dehydrogenase 1, mitochondrial isoform X2 n=1 Tax=Electrophorus electricus TaxID=8005 RepID=UPI0015D00D16|nr:proline dehydrogenase 1, mitochondrial isoform X2 [Electrophorus electricus]